MNSGNLKSWGPDELFSKANALRDQVRMRVENGLDKETTLSIVIDCLATTRELAKAWLSTPWDDQRAHVKYSLIDILLDLAPVVDAAMPLRKEIIDQSFTWLGYAERFNYDELKKGRLLYYWLRRADPGAVQDYHSRFAVERSESPYSDAELDAFYEENVQFVHHAMIREVFPDDGVVYKDPLRQQNAARYYEYCEKLLALAYGECELPNASEKFVK
jgi:hypothetical protein